MKEIETFQLDKNEEKLVELLQRFGYFHIDAKILTYMLRKKKAVSRQVERDMGLRQPEVSIGMKKLRKRGLIGKTTVRTAGKGRPTDNYHLKMKPDAIKVYIVKRADAQIAEKVSHLNELKPILEDITKN